MRSYFLVTALLVAQAATFARPSKEIVIASNGISPLIGTSMEQLIDSLGSMTISEASASRDFRPCSANVPSFGLGRHAHWLRFELRNGTMEPSIMISIPYPGIDELDIFMDAGQGFRKVVYSGLSRDRDLVTEGTDDLLFELPVTHGSTATILIRVRGFKHMHAPVQVGTAGAVYRTVSARRVAMGIYVGIMLVLFLYNIFVFASTRDRNYLYYVLSILALTCTQLSLQGQGPFNYLPVSGWFTARAALLFNLAAIPFGYEFARRFINTKQHAPGMDRWVPVIYGLLALAGGVYMFDPWTGQEMGNALSGIAAFYLLAMGIVCFRRGSRQAGFFLLAWFAFLVGVILFVLKDEGVIPYTTFTVFAMPIGSAIEGILLSFGLADRINVLRREKENSQAEALHMAHENERIIREQNVMLEEKVQRRTHALQESNDNLKLTQTQLVNAEKMASLGQLTAGIAHEINNPINFITSNISPLRRNISDLTSVIEEYRLLDGEDIGSRLLALRKREQELGVEESIKELDEIINSIAEGSSRTAEIVRGLRNFSRLDEGDLKEADLHEGLRSTMTVLAPQYRDKVDFHLELAELPKVECNPGKLNQVFMNILTNAAQATLARSDGRERKVTVRTGTEGEKVVISIADTGVGMSPEVRTRIFDPFFTTKAVGEGTGLGLAIVYGIINDHLGGIEVTSAPGVGTEFRIVLPIRREHQLEKRA